jgi:hypothetical protein
MIITTHSIYRDKRKHPPEIVVEKEWEIGS